MKISIEKRNIVDVLHGVINNPCSKKIVNTVQRTIHGEPLEAVDQHKYLEAEISSDLNCWNYRHRSLGFIRKNLSN